MCGEMGAEAKRYLQDHSIPQLFEGLMTGLIYNKPEDPIQFLENAINKLRTNPGMALKWDSFVSPSSSQNDKMMLMDNNNEQQQQKARSKTTKSTKTAAAAGAVGGGHKVKKKEAAPTTASPDNYTNNNAMDDGARPPVAPAVVPRATTNSPKTQRASAARDNASHASRKSSSQHQPQNNGTRSRKESWSSSSRPSSLVQAARDAYIPSDAPIILFIGGPGGGKTRYASKLQEELRDEGLVHICMPDLIRTSIARYKDRSAEWRVAAERYQRGELIPNELAQQLVRAEMGRQPYAKAYFVEGFPREARQVEDFERNVRPVDMALILDYDEDVLRRHMQSRGLLPEVIDRRIDEFKQKTLPSAKYFDDQRLLHLIPGEKEDAVIIERMRKLVVRAMRAGVGGARPAAAVASADSARQMTASPANGEQNTLPLMDGDGSAGRTASSASGFQGVAATTNMTAPVAAPSPSSAKVPSSRDGQRPIGTTAGRATSSPKQPPKHQQEGSRKATGGSAASTSSSKTRNAEDAPIRKATSNSAGSQQQQNGHKRNSGAGISASTPSSASSKKHGAAGAAAVDGTGRVAANVPIILVIGAPGSSKAKFAQNIAKKYEGFVFISMGEMLRRKVMQNGEDELWAKVGKKMDAGEMVPMRLCRELLYASVDERAPNSWGFVVEGYPRTLAQAEDLEAQLGHLDLALLVDCTEQFCKDTLLKRYTRDKEEGAERADDEESVVRLRMAQFKANTLPMLKSLDDNGKLRVVRLEEGAPPHNAVASEMPHAMAAAAAKIEGDTNEEAVFANMCQIIENTIFIQDDGNGKSLGSSKQNSADRLPPIEAQKMDQQSASSK